MLFRSLDDVTAGQALPELAHDVTTTTIVQGAAAAHVWRPMHHDRDYAVERQGVRDVFMDTQTQAGLGFAGHHMVEQQHEAGKRGRGQPGCQGGGHGEIVGGGRHHPESPGVQGRSPVNLSSFLLHNVRSGLCLAMCRACAGRQMRSVWREKTGGPAWCGVVLCS